MILRRAAFLLGFEQSFEVRLLCWRHFESHGHLQWHRRIDPALVEFRTREGMQVSPDYHHLRGIYGPQQTVSRSLGNEGPRTAKEAKQHTKIQSFQRALLIDVHGYGFKISALPGR